MSLAPLSPLISMHLFSNSSVKSRFSSVKFSFEAGTQAKKKKRKKDLLVNIRLWASLIQTTNLLFKNATEPTPLRYKYFTPHNVSYFGKLAKYFVFYIK